MNTSIGSKLRHVSKYYHVSYLYGQYPLVNLHNYGKTPLFSNWAIFIHVP